MRTEYVRDLQRKHEACLAERDRLRAVKAELLAACKAALAKLDALAELEFNQQWQKPLRERVRSVIAKVAQDS